MSDNTEDQNPEGIESPPAGAPFDPFEFCDALYKTPDGALIRHNARGVCNFNELRAWAEANPDQILPFPGPELAQVKADLCGKIMVLYEPAGELGFEYDGVVVQGDSKAQANLTSYVVAHIAGLLNFPLAWRLRDNTSRPILAEEFLSFAQAMTVFRGQLFADTVGAKDRIMAANTVAEAQAIFDNWTTKYGLS